MPYDANLAERIRKYLSHFSTQKVEEKEMFSGLAFLVNGKMCINVSGDKLMCRFDPALEEEVAVKKGYEPLMMKGKTLKGYCYIHPEGFDSKKDFEYFMNLCLDYNPKAKTSKKAAGRKRT